jgi:cell division protein FtsI/penicillin-binding protein 2
LNDGNEIRVAWLKRIWWILAVLFGLATLGGLVFSLAEAIAQGNGGVRPRPLPEEDAAVPTVSEPVKLDLRDIEERSGRYIVDLAGGRKAVLSLDPRLQKKAEGFLRSYKVPFGALAAIEPSTGRVLAYAEHSETDPERSFYSISKPYAAASLFKIVTAEALLSEKRIPVDEMYCYHGGRRRLSDGLLEDNPRRDRRCLTFEQAMGHSTNVVFARLAHRNLTAESLRRHAGSFLFGTRIPFEVDVAPSTAEIPEDRGEMAKTAAGFGDVRLTVLHAAMMAGAVANGGGMMRPFIVEEARGPDGMLVYAPQRGPIARVFPADVAAMLASMMKTTTTEGTAKKAFRRGRGRLDFKRAIPIAGKTGSLADTSGYYKEYTWYTGFGPVDNPKIAVAALVINHRRWKTKGSYAAREIFEEYFRNLGVYADARHATGRTR